MKKILLIALIIFSFSLSANAQRIILKSYGVVAEDSNGKQEFSDDAEIHLNFNNNTLTIFRTDNNELYEFISLINSGETNEFYILDYRASIGKLPCNITILSSKNKNLTIIIIDIGSMKLSYYTEFKQTI
jgi:hypothetical protein